MVSYVSKVSRRLDMLYLIDRFNYEDDKLENSFILIVRVIGSLHHAVLDDNSVSHNEPIGTRNDFRTLNSIAIDIPIHRKKEEDHSFSFDPDRFIKHRLFVHTVNCAK